MTVGQSDATVVLHPDDVTTLLTQDHQVLGYRISRSLLRPGVSFEKSRGDIQRIHDLDAYIERLEPIVRHIAGMSTGYEYLKISRQLVLDAREALGDA
jgi:predicted exporter